MINHYLFHCRERLGAKITANVLVSEDTETIKESTPIRMLQTSMESAKKSARKSFSNLGKLSTHHNGFTIMIYDSSFIIYPSYYSD